MNQLAQLHQLRAQREAVLAPAHALVAAAERAGRDLSLAEQAQFEDHIRQADALKAQIDRLGAPSAGNSVPGLAAARAAVAAASGVSIRPGAHIQTHERGDDDPRRGFSHFGEYAIAAAVARVAAKRPDLQRDPRLLPLAAAPSTSGGEGSGADGGFLVPPAFGNQLFSLSLDEESLLPYCDDMPVQGNSMQLPVDQTTPWGATGVQAYWQSEGQAATATKPSLALADFRLKKLIALAPVSNELLADAPAMGQYLLPKLASKIGWKANESTLYGAGNGTPIGAFTGLPNSQGAALVVAKDAGQTTNTLSVTNLTTMFARLPPGSAKRAIWMCNNDCLPALLSLTLGNFPVAIPQAAPAGGLSYAPQFQVFGRPVMVSQHCNSFSSQGDITLLDLSYYQAITKAAGVNTATSMHLYFDADMMAFRVTFRIDGAPKITRPISPAKGSNSMSPFVLLGAR